MCSRVFLKICSLFDSNVYKMMSEWIGYMENYIKFGTVCESGSASVCLAEESTAASTGTVATISDGCLMLKEGTRCASLCVRKKSVIKSEKYLIFQEKYAQQGWATGWWCDV